MGNFKGIKGGIFSAELPLTILPSILPSFVHLLLPPLVWPFTPPWRLQLLLAEREREEREEVVEEVEDARFVRASTLLLPFPSFASPNSAFYLTFYLLWTGSSSRGVWLVTIVAPPFHKTAAFQNEIYFYCQVVLTYKKNFLGIFYYIMSQSLFLDLLCQPLSSFIDPSRSIFAFCCIFFMFLLPL